MLVADRLYFTLQSPYTCSESQHQILGLREFGDENYAVLLGRISQALRVPSETTAKWAKRTEYVAMPYRCIESLESKELLTAFLNIDIESSPSNAIKSSLVEIADSSLFALHTTEHGTELWRTDGTSENTQLVTDSEVSPKNVEHTDLFLSLIHI